MLEYITVASSYNFCQCLVYALNTHVLSFHVLHFRCILLQVCEEEGGGAPTVTPFLAVVLEEPLISPEILQGDLFITTHFCNGAVLLHAAVFACFFQVAFGRPNGAADFARSATRLANTTPSHGVSHHTASHNLHKLKRAVCFCTADMENKLGGDIVAVAITLCFVTAFILVEFGVYGLLDHFLGDSVAGDLACIISGTFTRYSLAFWGVS